MTTTLTSPADRTPGGSGEPSPAGDFDEFYTSNLADVVALVCTITANISDAQDIAQEAFCRAWARWPDLSTYDNPGAWVRRVAVNLAYSRWRRLKAATAYLLKQRVDDVAPVNAEHLALFEELKAIPATQRRAIVLHHLMDLPVGDVANEMGVGESTVKSWLHRGRNALAIRLSDTPGAVIRKQSEQRRTRARIATASVAVLAVLGIVLTVVLNIRPATNPLPIGNSPTPSAIPSSPQPTGDITKTDWFKAAIKFADDSPCGGNDVVTFTKSGDRAQSGALSFAPASIAYGDLNGDGSKEAAMELTCSTNKRTVMIVATSAENSHYTLGFVAPSDTQFPSMWIQSGVLFSQRHIKVPPQNEPHLPDPVESHKWNGTAFGKTDDSSAYPALAPTQNARLDLAPVVSQMVCSGSGKPAKTTPNFGTDGRDSIGWGIRQSGDEMPYYAVLDPADFPYLLIRVGCTTVLNSEYSDNLVVFAQTNTGWRALSVINQESGDNTIYSWKVSGTTVTVSFGHDEQPTTTAQYTWNGTGFVKK